MGIFFRGKDKHHETPCDARDDGGRPWIRKDQSGKPSPMGWGSDEPRVVKRPGSDAHSQDNKPAMHGSKAERNLMGGTGALIRWSGDHVQVSGEKPTGRKR